MLLYPDKTYYMVILTDKYSSLRLLIMASIVSLKMRFTDPSLMVNWWHREGMLWPKNKVLH